MMQEMVSVNGIGWINRTEYGSVASGLCMRYQDRMDLRKEFFSYPFKGFGKLDDVSVMLCYSVALALKDAGIEYNAGCKQQSGIIGTNATGCLQSDINYFRDYIESGRVMARGNFFIYTLPSSPLGEAAIHFGLQGPLIYAAEPGGSLLPVFRIAADMIGIDGLPVMLAGSAEADEAVYCVLSGANGPGGNGGAICSLDEAVAIAENSQGISGMISDFMALNKERHSA